MAENEAYVPQLTLNPGGGAAAAQEFDPKAQEERCLLYTSRCV